MPNLPRALNAVKTRPGDPHAWSDLGQTLLQMGRRAAAEDAFSQSVRRAPTARGFAGWATCALEQGELARAVGILTVARKRGMLPMEGLRQLGVTALEVGDLQAADDALEEYTLRGPKDATGWLLRAIVRTRRSAAADALAMLDRAVTLDPGLVDAHANRAAVLETLSRLDDAELSARLALERSPSHPLAALILARVLRRQGRIAAAISVLDALSDVGLTAEQRTRRHGEQGLCADAQGHTDLAWTAFCEMNTHAAQRAAVADGDSAGWLTRVDRIRALAPALVAHARRAWTPPTEDRPPVFVVGFPRSGTTLLEHILGAHPALVATDEMRVTDRLFVLWSELLPDIGAYPDGLLELAVTHRLRLREAWASLVRTERPRLDPTLRIIDKVPLNLVHLPLLHAIFPESPKIVLLRDPRDTALSCFMHIFGPGATNNLMMSMDDIVEVQAKAFGVFAAVRSHMAESLQVVRYEELVTDHVAVMEDLLASIGLSWNDAVAVHHTGLADTHITTPSYARVMQPVDTSACKRWHRYARQLLPWRARLDETARLLGYEEDWPADRVDASG